MQEERLSQLHHTHLHGINTDSQSAPAPPSDELGHSPENDSRDKCRSDCCHPSNQIPGEPLVKGQPERKQATLFTVNIERKDQRRQITADDEQEVHQRDLGYGTLRLPVPRQFCGVE